MTKKHPLQKLIETTDLELDIHSYSGRGMFGRTCLGITGHLPTIIGRLMVIMLEADDLSASESQHLRDAILSNVSFDAMGLDSVVYFPNVPFVEDDEDRILDSPDDEDEDEDEDEDDDD